MAARQVELTVQALARSTWIVGGLLLVAIGIGDLAVGRSKLAQYQEVLTRAPETPPRDPATLFPKATESEEQRAVAAAKVGFYRLLFVSGQLLTLGGLVLLVVGLLQLRPRAVPDAAEAPRSR
ncbi:MAG TPA: hypothetical protein VMS22_09065 [Candidatus Eisenbacteria bacterium]|nr:hypothetical protein [Candidatus Eisenbacteria bacterium]